MKTTHQIIYFSFLVLLVSCNHERKAKVVMKETFSERNPDYPKEFVILRRSLSEKLDGVHVSINAGYTDSTWTLMFIKNENTHGAFMFSYYLLPEKLSSGKLAHHMSMNMKRSCMVDEYTSKKFVYEDYIFEPGCGNIDEGRKKYVDAFYQTMEKLGAKEIAHHFLPGKEG